MNRDEIDVTADSLSHAGADEAILAEFARQLDGPEEVAALLTEYVSRHPSLAERLQGIVRAQPILDGLPATPETLLAAIGRYRVTRRVRIGGMGEVYEAIDEQLQRRVAIKLVRPDKISPEARLRFDREQRVLAQLHHTHIVPIYDAGAQDGMPYFVMPYVEGAALHHIVSHVGCSTTNERADRTPTLREIAERLAPLRPDQLDRHGTGATSDVAALPKFSRKYFESAALAMIDIAEAVQAAHDIEIVHRDLKPSNVMIDSRGHAWLIDLGLAREGDAPVGDPDDTVDDGKPSELTQGLVGTPRYMAPEQYQAGFTADARTDVWGLGAILFELITMQSAFPGKDRLTCRHLITGPEPSPRARDKNPRTPRDLNAICARALQKDRNKRYATASAFAADLRRYLRREPTTARPAWPPRRVYLWARRNKGWAAAMAAGVLVASLFVKSRLDAQNIRSTQSERRSATLRADANRDLALASLRRGMADKALSGAVAGWSRGNELQKLATLVTDAQSRRALQTFTADALHGIDAATLREFPDRGANHLAWAGTRNELLLGSVFSERGLRANALWNQADADAKDLSVAAIGPVGFLPDGRRLQLITELDDQSRTIGLKLVSLSDGAPVQTFRLPEPIAKEFAIKASVSRTLSHVAAIVLAPRHGFVPSGPKFDDNAPRLLVWDTANGAIEFSLSNIGIRSADHSGALDVANGDDLTALALSADGGLAAVGEEFGAVRIWSTSERKLVSTLASDRRPIRSLTFAKDYRRYTSADTAGRGWLLAAGDASGTTVVWDLSRESVRTICRGGHYDIWSADFTDDGATLVTVGLQEARIWDVASGRLLLRLPTSSYHTPEARFSADGKLLALGQEPTAHPPTTTVWELDHGRGITALRGLVGQVSKIAFSADATLVAAMTHDWRIGMWRADGGLVGVFEVNPGLVADNAAIAIRPDGRQLAFASGESAEIWDLQTGQRLKTWRLPRGLVDMLAYTSGGELRLVRMETENETNSRRVVRVRNLQADDLAAPVREIRDFSQHVYSAELSPDGVRLAIDGLENNRRRVAVYNLDTGKSLDIPTRCTLDWGTVKFDPTGACLFAVTDESGRAVVVDAHSGALRSQLESCPACLGVNGEFATMRHIAQDATEETGLEYSSVRSGDALITFRVDLVGSAEARFSSNQRFLAWGNPDGTVSLCELPEVQRRLTALGLGWSDSR